MNNLIIYIFEISIINQNVEPESEIYYFSDMVPAIEKLKGENLNIKINKLIIYIFEISIINQNVEPEPEIDYFSDMVPSIKIPQKVRLLIQKSNLIQGLS